jgi:hypothetical protein
MGWHNTTVLMGRGSEKVRHLHFLPPNLRKKSKLKK